MRTPLEIPSYLVKQACLYAPGRPELDAVCHILEDYPRLVGDIRQLRRRVADLDAEGVELDALIDKLRVIAAQIAEL